MSDIAFWAIEIIMTIVTVEVAFPGMMEDWPMEFPGPLMLIFFGLAMSIAWPLFLPIGLIIRALQIGAKKDGKS